jgi:23S rRNA (uracil1939-C5)-methyltransferase
LSASGALEVTVRAVAAGGSGVADLPDGRVVFIPRTAPGDRVAIDIEKSKSRWAIGALRRVLVAGPERREAPCALYATCGGCQLQHLPYAVQLAWKGRFVADALARIGGLGEVEPPEVVPSPRAIGYRNRITYTLRRLRGGRVVAGFHALARPAMVLDVRDECLLPEPPLVEAWAELRAGWGTGARLLPSGGRLRLTLRTADGPVALVVEGGPAGWRASELGEAVPGLSAIYHRPGDGGGAPRLAHGDEGGLGGAFVQANEGAAALLRAHVEAVAGRGEGGSDAGGGPMHAVDAYCGVADFGAALARNGWRVSGVELDRDAVARARARPEPLDIVEGRVEERLPSLLPADLLVLNPPRTGLAPDVPAAILTAPPERIVYVSCDPATLARDLGALSGAYVLDGLRAFDLFPQTAHVETVAHLTLAEGAG